MGTFFDRFTKRYQRLQDERRKQARVVASDDDVPLPDMPVEQAHAEQSVGRNDPCPCGSGKKYKKCCGRTP